VNGSSIITFVTALIIPRLEVQKPAFPHGGGGSADRRFHRLSAESRYAFAQKSLLNEGKIGGWPGIQDGAMFNSL
jgi:hypothetical protein